MRYSEEIIEEVRERNDIVDVISNYVSLKKKGSSWFGLCPFHNEKTPSFSVSRDKQMFYCFGCGKGGNVFTFLMEYNRETFPESVKELAQRAGVELPEVEMTPEDKRRQDARTTLREMNKQAAIYFHYLLKSKRGALGYQYLKDRGLTDATINHFGLGYADIYRDDLYQFLKSKGFTDYQMKDSSLVTIDSVRGSYDTFFHRVMFPIMDAGQRVIGFGGRVMGDGEPKYLNSRETILFDKKNNLYGLNYARRSKEKDIILCEGYMDVISLHQAGITNAVAPLGTAFTLQQALLLKRYTNQVILSFDSDGAGVRAALRALPILRENGLQGRVLSLKPYKDPDELIKAEGAEGYRKRIKEAEPGYMFQMIQIYGSHNQHDPQERVNAIREIGKFLAEIEDPLERSTYVGAASNRFMINKKDLYDMVNQFGIGVEYQKANARYKKEPRTQEKREKEHQKAVNKPQKLLLTWIADYPQLYPLIAKYVGPEDFLHPLYHGVALMVYEQMEKDGKLNPAMIISKFTDVDQQSQVASLFNAKLDYTVEDDAKGKALTEVIRKVKMASIDDQMAHISDVTKWGDLLAKRKKIQSLKLDLSE